MKYRIVLWMCHEVSLSLGVRVLHFLTSYLSVMLIRWLLWHQTECSADIKHWSVIQTSFNLSVSCAHSILSVYLHIMLWHVARPRIYTHIIQPITTIKTTKTPQIIFQFPIKCYRCYTVCPLPSSSSTHVKGNLVHISAYLSSTRMSVSRLISQVHVMCK